ncbi:hypothetical protein A3H89_03500 [Candidatus Amesbacteria bacterium RIFCSPLOWO2_02_FULL_48_11]|uniref:Uncharacterized protein n=3 Tax=Candidatus Amesiibacteriota TaxID=1752730 RepID=A0A1F4Z622_9BACT|nr:MAG: hypothetical protein UY22_C0018G0011 [Candidatus Amesbacteria bacterium GW2011_GWC1_48_10]OGC89153.1 MAG: hypothetical protein A2V48_00740 [Candidatus Amesbacteria bacterium RBG_19FT_COMBO_48_16]OGC96634.1 MAG: hypothetical protein A3C34_00830 [Candidatus Amesbacteria bacterium RIFCSPHIGHO2_02_FULL_48_21]OGC99376.1 MAG: hypothetical protein A2W16_02015 [Candidatus Amesbacteria bacterium RBG_16_48_31]OGD00241.1 MAG: hypothetical protein A2702_01930 [Candidatus Amesbacteria bacterium RIFC
MKKVSWVWGIGIVLLILVLGLSWNISKRKDGGLFKSRLVNLSFQYPEGVKFEEVDRISERKLDSKTGRYVSFFPKERRRGGLIGALSFDAVSSDFKDADWLLRNVIEGDLTSTKSFHIIEFDKKSERIIEKSKGVYQVIGYTDIECSPFVETIIVVAPPVGSGLRYIIFYPAEFLDFMNENFPDPCLPDERSINERMDRLEMGKEAEVEAIIKAQVEIAKTFSTR